MDSIDQMQKKIGSFFVEGWFGGGEDEEDGRPERGGEEGVLCARADRTWPWEV